MASQGPSTRLQPQHAPPPAAPPPAGGVDLTTLLLSAVASAAAAYITSKIWAPGALASAAMSPIIVALVKEALRKPTEVVTAVVPTRTRGRGGRSGGMTVESERVPADLPERLEGGAPPPFPPPAPGVAEGPVRVYSTAARRLRWRLAVITGLLGFAICVVVYTVPEVIAGGSVAQPGHGTTFWGGSSGWSGRATQPRTTTTTVTTTTTPSDTTTQPTQTVTQTVTTPAPAPAASSPTPTTPSSPPAATTPAPDQPSATTP
jgi:hypothetical protein